MEKYKSDCLVCWGNPGSSYEAKLPKSWLCIVRSKGENRGMEQAHGSQWPVFLSHLDSSVHYIVLARPDCSLQSRWAQTASTNRIIEQKECPWHLLMIAHQERRSVQSFQKKIEIQYTLEKVEDQGQFQPVSNTGCTYIEREKQFAQIQDHKWKVLWLWMVWPCVAIKGSASCDSLFKQSSEWPVLHTPPNPQPCLGPFILLKRWSLFLSFLIQTR